MFKSRVYGEFRINQYSKGSDYHHTFSDNTSVVSIQKDNCEWPIAYIRKPKGLQKEKWERLIQDMRIFLDFIPDYLFDKER